ncbi:MAG: class I SAM-dependent methyltransferase [Solirubrobacterales bacterium]
MPVASQTPSRCRACGSGPLVPHLRVQEAVGGTGLVPTTDRYGVALSNIACCKSCGHMQLERLPSEAELADAYRVAVSGDYIEEEPGQRATARRILATIERHRAPGRLVDLGCWVGFFVSEAVRRGWVAVGVEPSEFASDYARRELGLDVRTAGLFEAELSEASFDAVFMGDVIEHVPAADEAVGRARSLLTGGGVLAMALPDAGSRLARLLGRRWWSVIPTHVHYFTRHSLATLLQRQGFEVLEITTSPKVFTVGYYLDRLGGYQTRLGRGLARGAAAAGIGNRLWAPDFRDRMLVIARLNS